MVIRLEIECADLKELAHEYCHHVGEQSLEPTIAQSHSHQHFDCATHFRDKTDQTVGPNLLA